MDKVTLKIRVQGEPVEVEADRPPERIRIDQALPFLRVLDDKVIDIAVRKNGKPISCSKGCSACCRAQPVPITPPEAYALLLLVEALPEPRRSQIRARFADRVASLGELADSYLNRRDSLTPEQARATAYAYWEKGLACPFLEDDACSIYHDRPFVCRQYLVTSHPDLCRNPLESPVQPVPMLIAPAISMLQVATDLIGTPQYSIPLVLALVYGEAHRHELERTYSSGKVYDKSVRALLE